MVIRRTPLPPDVASRLDTLAGALERVPGVVFAYVFGGAGRESLSSLSDIDLAVYVDEHVDLDVARLEVIGAATGHLGTDEVDVVVLNTAPTSLVGRVLLSRRVILDRDPYRRHRFESLALRESHDFRHIERRLLAERYGRGRS